MEPPGQESQRARLLEREGERRAPETRGEAGGESQGGQRRARGGDSAGERTGGTIPGDVHPEMGQKLKGRTPGEKEDSRAGEVRDWQGRERRFVLEVSSLLVGIKTLWKETRN